MAGFTSHYFLISGYRGTGKNTFANHLQKKDSRFRYTVFSRTQFSYWRGIQLYSKHKEVSFAKALKKEVAAILGLDSWLTVDKRKNTPLTAEEHIAYAPYWGDRPAGDTVRDVLIDRARYWLKQDPCHYARIAMERECFSDKKDYIITDWRYLAEHQYISEKKGANNVITIRIIRAEVPVPPLTDDSEHQLDDFKPDFIVIPKGDKASRALVPKEYLRYRSSFP